MVDSYQQFFQQHCPLSAVLSENLYNVKIYYNAEYQNFRSDRENTKRVIEIPDAIVVDMGVFHRVEDQDNLKRLLCKLSRAGISRSSKGQIKIDGAYFDNYEDGVVSCCDGNFNEKYNELYSLLKYYNITF